MRNVPPGIQAIDAPFPSAARSLGMCARIDIIPTQDVSLGLMRRHEGSGEVFYCILTVGRRALRCRAAQVKPGGGYGAKPALSKPQRIFDISLSSRMYLTSWFHRSRQSLPPVQASSTVAAASRS